MALAREMTLSLPGVARRERLRALNLIFPPLCVSCRMRVGEAHSLCATCWNAISFIEGPVCALLRLCPSTSIPEARRSAAAVLARPHDFARARSLFRYDDASKPLILAFKHGDRLDHAPAFARWLERTGHAAVRRCGCCSYPCRSIAGSCGSGATTRPRWWPRACRRSTGVPHDPLSLEQTPRHQEPGRDAVGQSAAQERARARSACRRRRRIACGAGTSS